jgi:hypothetical protein
MEHLFYRDTLSVEKGLAICKAFFFSLWSLLQSKLPSEEENWDIYQAHKIFCQTICNERGTGSSAEWNEAIFLVTQISKESQREFKLTPDDLFNCMIEFSKIYDKRYESNLNSLIQLVESMKKDPTSYWEEWKLLKKSIAQIGSRLYIPFFNWQEIYSEQEGFSVEQGFAVCINFFMDLWDLIEPKLPRPEPNNENDIHELFCRME